MNKDRFSWLRRKAGLGLSLVIASGFLVPAASLAAMNRTISTGGDGHSGGEGDPLDSNDHSGGGGGGGVDYEEDTLTSGRDSGPVSFLSLLTTGRKFVLIPEFQSGTLVFRLVILDVGIRGLEE